MIDVLKRSGVAVIVAVMALSGCSNAQTGAIVDTSDPTGDFSAAERVCVPLHVGFFGDITTVTLKQRGVFYRQGTGAWGKVPIDLNGPHSIARLPDGKWLINDTDNHRMVQLDDFAGTGEIVIRSELAGYPLRRPHDQIVDPTTGDVYLVDGNRRLFRFKDLNSAVDAWTFPPEQLGYIRGMSWFDGRLHMADATRGEVHRIDDFDRRIVTTFRSPTPPPPAPPAPAPHRNRGGGSLGATGLVLNDVEKVDGWYYGTNFFHPFAAWGGDPQPGRLIRWRSWEDFAQGRWEDLTQLLPQTRVPLIPYFLTLRNGYLYTGLFDHDEPAFGPTDADDPCRYDRLFRLDLSVLEKTQIH